MLDRAREGAFALVVPDLVRDETLRVLATTFGWSREQLAVLDGAIAELAADIPATPATAEPVTGDASDDRILACALAVKAEVLVSGDRRHLLPLERRGALRIITPQALLAELRA